MTEKNNNSLSDEAMKPTRPVVPIPSLNIDELEENQCVQPVDGEYEYFFHVSPKTTRNQACDACGSMFYYKDGKSKDRIVSDISMGLNRVLLQVEVPRYQCQDCGHKFSHKFDCLMPNMQFTRRLYEQLQRRVFEEPFSRLAEEYGTTIPTISKILTDQGEYLDASHPLVAPRVLGIDEKHIERHARAIYVNIETGTLLDMSPNNRKETVEKVITSMDGYENIEIVTTDMAQGYKPLIEEILPNAKIVVDKYHVVQALSKATSITKTLLTEISHSEVNALPAGEERMRKDSTLTKAGKDSYLFKFKEKSVMEDEKRKSIMAELCEEFPNFNTLRLLKDGFMRIYQSTSRDEADQAYDEWKTLLKNADKELFLEFHHFGGTVKRWHKEIFQYFEPGCQFTNAASEGINSLIQAVNTQGRGYGFETLRIKVLYRPEAALTQRVFRKQKSRFDGGEKGYMTVIDRPDKNIIPDRNGTLIEPEIPFIEPGQKIELYEYYTAVPRGAYIEDLLNIKEII